jgi:hypothetical protein
MFYLSQTGTGFPAWYVAVLFSFVSGQLKGEVIIRFVNIDGIVDHHSLCFLLKKVRQHAGTANPSGAPEFTHGS